MWHRNNAFELQQFQKTLDAFANGKVIQLILGEQEVRDLAVFKKRIGEKQTLENLSIEFGVTRERIRQISKSFDNLITVKKTETIISNFSSATALYVYFDLLFAANGGVVKISDLYEKCKKWLREEDDFNFILHFIKVNFSPSENKDCLFLENYRCLQCAALKNAFAEQIHLKRIIDYDQIREIMIEVCSQCTNGKCPVSGLFIPTFFDINLQNTCVYDTEDQSLYHQVEYDLQKGSSKNVVKALFTKNSVMTFDEIFKQLLLYRPDMTERRAYGCIQRADLVLADRGRYMLKDSLPLIPFEIYQPILDDIYEKIHKKSNALFSVTIVFKKYQKQLSELKCTTPYILFEILKKINPAGIRFIKCPYITSESNTDNFSLSDLLEEYIAENGKTPLASARDYFCTELGISKAVFTISYNRADKLIVDDENNLIYIDDLNITREKIQDIVASLEALGSTETTTATKLYTANEASCLLLDITGPKMLFNILRLFESDCFFFRYPQISKSSDNIVAIRQQLIDFVKNTKSFCTREQLEDYCKEEHLSDRNLYLTHETYPELFNYLPSTWVHIETIGYAPQWIDQVSLVAQKVLDDSSTPQRSYSYLDIICEYEDELPKLASDELFWTSTLVGEILKESGKFLVYGKNHLVFSAKNDKNKLNNFGDLCALLLDEEFGGAANLHDFSSYLRSKELISNADLHDSLLQGSDRIVIDGMEVYTKRGQEYAE